MRVEVRNNNVDGALRVLKKKLQQDGLFNEMRNREYHETKGENVEGRKLLADNAGLKNNDGSSIGSKHFTYEQQQKNNG